MAERGEYRAIARVLLDGPDYQTLTERARHVFLVLKISFGPAGIEIVYPEALRAEIRDKSGMPPKAVNQALDELCAKNWIRIERNVVWIIEQLRFDPHMKAADWKHRLAIQRHIAGMPRLQIVADFRAHYQDWFVDQQGCSQGLSTPSQGPSEADRSTRPMTDDKTDDKTNTDNHHKTHQTHHPRAHTPEVSEADVDRVIIAANNGLRTALGERFNPIPLSHGSRQDVIDWLAAGIPPDVAEQAVRETAERYKPNGTHRQINTMKYFTDAVNEAYERTRSAARNTQRAKPGRTAGKVAGKGKGKFDHLIERPA